MKKAFDQTNYEESLIDPPGGINIKVLEKILDAAHIEELGGKDRVRVKGTRRVKNFNPKDPDWVDYTKTFSLLYLKRLYRKAEGRPYRYDSEKHINPPRGAHFGPVILQNSSPMLQQQKLLHF